MNRNILLGSLLAAVCGWWLLVAEVALAAGPGVHGRVLGHDEQGKLLGVVGGAKIEFQSRGGASAASITADNNGYFKVDLPAGEYLYKITAPGYRTEQAGRGLRLAQSQGYAIFNLALTKGQDDPAGKPPEIPVRPIGKLTGRVLEKTPADTVGIGAARITLRREGARELVTVVSRVTAEGTWQVGDYEIALEAGRYQASVAAAGFETLVDPNPIEIRAREEARRDFLLSRERAEPSTGQGIQGMVTIIDAEQTPTPIRVQIWPLGRGRETPLTVPPTSSLAFTQDLPPGRYRVTAAAEGFPTAASPPVYVLEGRYTRVNLALRAKPVPEPQTRVEVFVHAQPVGMSEPVALPGARVTLHRAGTDPATAAEGTTDRTGHAVFPVSEAGEYLAEAHLAGYRAGSGRCRVETGQSHEVAIALVKEAAPPAELLLQVTVLDAATRQPLAGARVLARHAEQSLAEAARGVTDARGQTPLTVTRGTYAALAQLLGYEPGGARTEVAPGQANRLVISLRPMGRPTDQPEPVTPIEPRPLPPDDFRRATVTGYVAYRELSGQLRSVPGTSLVWERVAVGQRPFAQVATTGSNGRYQIELPPGAYQVRVDPPAPFEGTLERVDVALGTQEKYFLVRRAARPEPPPPAETIRVEGQVVSEPRAGRVVPVASAEILLIGPRGAVKAESGRGGSFETQLVEGRYRVQVRAQNYEPLDTSADVRRGMSPLRLVLQQPESPSAEFRLNVVVVERAGGRIAQSLRPVSGAQVQVAEGRRSVTGGTTDSTGRFTAQVRLGTYTIQVEKRGYSGGSAEVTVTNRDVTEQIVLARSETPGGGEPAGKPTLTVHVTRQLNRPTPMIRPVGTPLAGAAVTVMRGSSQVAAGKTDAAGIFRVPLSPGEYAVKAFAEGFAPAGTVAAVGERDVNVELKLGPTGGSADESKTERRTPDSSASSKSGGASSRGRNPAKGDNIPDQRPSRTWYIVEHRANSQAPWVRLGQYSSEREAQAALFRAVERGQISGGAPAESRIRTIQVPVDPGEDRQDRRRP